MLVLSLKPMESISVGDDITITVYRSSFGSVRLGIDAPRSIPIVRNELNPHPNAGTAAKSRDGGSRYEGGSR